MGANVTVFIPVGLLADRTLATAETDASGRYSLSFESEGIGCDYRVVVTAPLFFSNFFFGSDVGCTDGVQTLNVRLGRIPPESGRTGG